MATTLLAAIGAAVLILNAATRLPAAAAVFLRALIPLIRAFRAVIGELRAGPSEATSSKKEPISARRRDDDDLRR